MASSIQNTATVTSFTYISGGREITGGPRFDTVVNEYVEPTITLSKVCSIEAFPTATGADINEEITLNYTVTNTSGASITYTSGTIVDTILVHPSVEIVEGSETGGTHVNDTITLDMGEGINPGEHVIYTIKIKVTSPDAPINLLHTHATATLSTVSGTTNSASDTCDLDYNHAELAVSKQNNPDSICTSDQEITYTIVITNSANTAGTVNIRNFSDPIPEFTTFLRIDNDGGGVFDYEETPTPKIYNVKAFTLEHGEFITLQFTVITIHQQTNVGN